MATTTVINGIDVSKHQGSINWSGVKEAGIQFAILRAGYGREISQKDAQFENNYAGCKSNGIPCGVYWYSYAMTPDEAKKEAAVCLEVLKGKTFEYPIYFDLEEKKQFDLGKDACTEIVKAFLETVEKAGYWVGLYSSSYYLTNYIDESVRTRYAVWVAHYGVKKPSYKGTYGIWQKSSTGSVNGISGDVDLNECYVDYPAAIKKAGLNGFTATATSTTTATAAEPEKTYFEYTVKRGDTLWELAQKYLKNGSRYKEIMTLSCIKSETIYVNQVLRIPNL